MAEKEKKEKKSESQALGPSVVLGLVGAIVVLLLLGAGIWGVSRIVTRIRENNEETQEEEVAEAEEEEDEEAHDEEGNEDEQPAEGEDDQAVEEGEQPAEGEDDQAVEEGEQPAEGEEEQPEEGQQEQEEGEEQVKPEEEGEQEEEEQENEEETEEGTPEEDDMQPQSVSGPWIANNYVSGDITGDQHTVVRGDTLWEIAEGRYGSGFEWQRILDANLDKVGYLPNGSRALIFPGQVLDLPDA